MFVSYWELVVLPLRAPVHAMSSYGLGHFCSDPTDVNQLRWVPDEGEAVSELVSLWLQPGLEKPFVLSLALLAGKVDSGVCGVISALRPDVVTDSFRSFRVRRTQGAATERSQMEPIFTTPTQPWTAAQHAHVFATVCLWQISRDLGLRWSSEPMRCGGACTQQRAVGCSWRTPVFHVYQAQHPFPSLPRWELITAQHASFTPLNGVSRRQDQSFRNRNPLLGPAASEPDCSNHP